MTLEELAMAWEKYLEDYNDTDIEKNINNFANIYSNTYEEYMTILEILSDAYKDELNN
jgi:hypothetical protein